MSDNIEKKAFLSRQLNILEDALRNVKEANIKGFSAFVASHNIADLTVKHALIANKVACFTAEKELTRAVEQTRKELAKLG